MKKLFTILALMLLPYTAYAQVLTTHQGGTGLSDVAAGSIPFGSVFNIRMATSSDFQWNNSTSNLNFKFGSSTAFSATTLCLVGDSCRTTWPTGTFPFDAQTYGNSTTSVTAFLNGLLSNSTTTITGPLHFNLSNGGLAVFGNLVSSGATTTAGTGLTYTGNAFNVNTSQNIATLSNLSSNGFLYTAQGNGTLNVAASSSIFGYTPLNPTRTLTVAGTANQITSSAGAQDLSADRTWTLSVPQNFQFPLSQSSIFATSTYASTTVGTIATLFFTNATGTSLALTASTTIGGVFNAMNGALFGNSTTTNATTTSLKVTNLTIGSDAVINDITGTGLTVSGNALTVSLANGTGVTCTGNTCSLAAINANSVLANNTSGSAIPSAVATSTLFGIPTPGFVLGFLNGQNTFVATTTFTGGSGISTAFANGQVTITNTGLLTYDPFPTHPTLTSSATSSGLIINNGSSTFVGGVTMVTSTTTNATTTVGVFTVLASTTDLVISNAPNCSGSSALTTNVWGKVACGAIASGGTFPFTPNAATGATSFMGQVSNSTTTQIHFGATGIALSASSTSLFNAASSTFISSTANAMFAMAGGELHVGTTTDSLFFGQDPGITVDMQNNSTSEEGLAVVGNVNDFLENNLWNRSAGTGAQSCFTGTRNDGTGTTGFLAGCINSTGFNNPQAYNAGNQGDTNFISMGNDFWIANGVAAKNTFFTTGGVATSSIRLTIDGLGNAVFGTSTAVAGLGYSALFGNVPKNLTLFQIASSSQLATTTIFTIKNNGYVGIGSSTPTTSLSVGSGTASSSITVAEYSYGQTGNNATSTAATLSPQTANQINWPMGTSATTLTLCNFIPGQHLLVRVSNPNGVAGALTWAVCSGTQLLWAGKTVPTQTTTANDWDIYSFTASAAVGSTSPTVIMLSGAQSAGF